MADAPAPQTAPQRKRLALKPRDPEAAARLEAERQAHLASKSPFGDAKPREVVIAQKVGKTEEEVLKEEVSKEKLHLRLSGAQLEEKRQAEAEIEEAREALSLEDDDAKRAALQAQLDERQKKLDDLMESFAKVTLETALSGGAPRVSQIRQQQQLVAEQGAPGAPSAPGYGQGRGGYGQGQGQGQGQQYGGGGGSFGGREFTEAGGRGGGGGGSRGFPRYQERGGFSDSYQQPERQGGGGRRGSGPRLPEWALDDASDAGFYDAPAATSAFIASGGYQGSGSGGGSYGGGRGGRGGRNNRGGGGGGGGGFGSGGYSRGLGGEFQFPESDSGFGAGQDRF